MSYKAVEIAIQARVSAQWGGWPLQYPNAPEETSVDDYGMFYTRSAVDGSFQKAFGAAGGPEFRHTGLLVAKFFTPLGQQTGRVLEQADTFRLLFQGQSVAGTGVVVRFRAGNVRQVGEAPGTSRFQVNVEVPFYWDATS